MRSGTPAASARPPASATSSTSSSSSNSSSSSKLATAVKIGVVGIVTLGVAYWAYTRYYAPVGEPDRKRRPEDASSEGAAESGRTGGAAYGRNDTSSTGGVGGDTRKISLYTASRDDVVSLLKQITEVNKELNVLVESVTAQVAANNCSLVDTYQLLKDKLPEEPLERHGVSISHFDQLLARFEQDNEVRNLVVEVVQGSDAASSSASVSTGTGRDKAFDMSPDTIVQINAAMRDRLEEVSEELKDASQSGKLENPLHSRTASLTAQAMVGAFVRVQYGYSAEDVERAMNLHTYELSHREDFMAISDDIQGLMQRFIQPQI